MTSVRELTDIVIDLNVRQLLDDEHSETRAALNAAYAPVHADRLLGRHEFNPAVASSISVSSTTPAYIGGPVTGQRDFSVDFVAPTSGRVRFTASIYTVNKQNAADEYLGMAAIILGDAAELPGSKRLMNRRGAQIVTNVDGVNYGGSGMGVDARVTYEHVITGLIPGATYSVAPLVYSLGGQPIQVVSGGAYGPTVLTVHEAAESARNPFGVTGTKVAGPTTLVSDTKYNAFPGVVKCPNGDILAAYRKGDTHTTGGASCGLYTIRSTDGGATWGAPVTVANDPTYDYGTATLSEIGGGKIALVYWLRPNAGGTPYVNGTRIITSTNNGASWSAPITVDTGAWLGKYSVSESALIYHDGAYYLGVWGEDAGTPAGSYQAGILRSTDLATWTRVARFDTGGVQGYNEIGVGVVDGTLVALIRHESQRAHYASTSTDGVTWTAPRAVRAGGHGAPKLTSFTLDGLSYLALRHGTAGPGYVAAVDAAGNVAKVAAIEQVQTFVYGQAVPLSESSIGVLYALDHGSNDSRIYWTTYTLA